MQALVVDPDHDSPVEFTPDHPEPTLLPGEVLVRVHLAGICSTDLEIARGYLQFRGVPGHEFVGTVVAGSDRLQNCRVVAEINCPCQACDTCRRGLLNHCPRRTVLGIAGRDGAFAELLRIPERNCHAVPDNVSDRQAVFVEPLAAAVHVLDAAPLNADARVAVLGAGRLGLLVAQVVALRPYALDVIDRNPRALERCVRRGLHTLTVDEAPTQPTYDVIVECTGSPDGLRLAAQLCRPTGTIVLKSTYAGHASLDLAPVVVNELRIVGNRCGPFAAALQLLASGRVQVEDLISGTYPLSDGVAALAAAARPESLKVLIQPGGS